MVNGRTSGNPPASPGSTVSFGDGATGGGAGSGRRRRICVSAVGLTLATNLLVVAGGTQVANASVTNEVGQIINEDPPAAVIQGANEDSTNMRLFQEKSQYVLPTGVGVDISPPSTFPTTYSQLSGLTPSTIPTGTSVDSYFIFSDPVGRPLTNYPYSVTVRFSSPILGVIARDQSLNSSDATLSAVANGKPTRYAPEVLRGLEIGPTTDQVELVTPTEINLKFSTSADIDEVRVITAGSVASPPTTMASPMYTEVASDGGIFNFGSTFYGSEGSAKLNQPMVGGAQDLLTGGYWTVASDGGIFSFDAPFYGSTGSLALTKPVVAMSPTDDGLGYWLFASDGGVFSFGDANFYGSEGGLQLQKPVVGGASDPKGSGYWMVASDGGVFSFNAAQFYGSTGGEALNKPIVGMTPTPDGAGYWLVASDGGIFSFGDAKFFGSTGGLPLNAPIVAMKATPDGQGYWLIAADGGVFSYGDAPFLGSMGAIPLNKPVVGGF